MMREIVTTTLGAQPDMHVVATVEAEDTLADAVVRTQADVVVVGLAPNASPTTYDDLLYQHPRLRVLMVTDDGRGALLSALRPQQVAIDDVSPAGLVEAIRASANAEAR